MFAISLGLFTMAQQAQQFKSDARHNAIHGDIEIGQNYSSATANVKPPSPNLTTGAREMAVIIRELGNAGNAWGLSSGARTYMWADNDVHSVVFLHRMLSTPGTGFLAFDVSTDQGATFAVDQQVYDPGLYPLGADLGNARYPQVAIYNPEGNVDPANAYLTFFAPIFEKSNGATWGGYGMGTNPLTAVNPSTPLQSAITSPGDPYLFSVPDAFFMTGDNQAISYEPALVDGQFDNYTGELIYTSGYFNEGTQLFDYEQKLIEFDIEDGGEGGRIYGSKIAFHPDGQVGYMAMLSNNGELDYSEFTRYPILFKTTDGGVSWDGPFTVQISGPDGLPAVLNYLSDDLLIEMFGEVPPRDTIRYTAGRDMGLSVDMNGNPHLFFPVGLRYYPTNWSMVIGITGEPGTSGLITMVHASSYDGMNTWYADTLNSPETYQGVFPGSNDLSEELRPYISTTPDASKLFFSWQESNLQAGGDNIAPDIYCIGHRVADRAYTKEYNVTTLTDIMWQAWMGTASYYVFDDGAGNYEIPFVVQLMDISNNLDPVEFRYVDDFVITDADFGVWVSNDEVDQEYVSISSNYPNPATNMTNVNMTLLEPANVTLEISNLIGQKVKSINYGPHATGLHTISINVTDLESGIYIYTLSTGKDVVAGKMIVE